VTRSNYECSYIILTIFSEISIHYISVVRQENLSSIDHAHQSHETEVYDNAIVTLFPIFYT